MYTNMNLDRYVASVIVPTADETDCGKRATLSTEVKKEGRSRGSERERGIEGGRR